MKTERRGATIQGQRSAELPVGYVTDVQARGLSDSDSLADLEVGDTAGLETCATSRGDRATGGGVKRLLHRSGGSFGDPRLRAILAALAWLALGNGCQSPKPAPTTDLNGGWLPSQAQVAGATGSGCRAQAPGGPWRRLQVGDWLAPGTLVEAKPFTRLRLRFYEAGIMVEVKPGSLLRLDKLSYRKEGHVVVTSTLVDLRQGELAVDKSALTPGSEFVIKTPQGLKRIPAAATE